MPSDEKKSEKLSAAWQAIVKNYNISEEFARNLRDSVIKCGHVIGMRTDERFHQPVSRQFAAKPGIIKLKTGNWGWMQEAVPYDQQHLAKSFEKVVDGRVIRYVKPGDHSEHTKNPEKFPNSIALMTKQITLQEIIKGHAAGEYTVQQDLDDPKRIIAIPKKNAPDDTKVVFSIRLDVDASKQSLETSGTQIIADNPAKPDWWKDDWGNFNTALQYEYPAQYRVGNNEFQDLLIYAIPLHDKKYPVGKDNDGFLRGISKKDYDEMPREVNEVVNTFTLEGAEKMLDGLIILHEYFWKKENPGKDISQEVKNQIAKEIDEYKIERFGAGTPYDFYVATKQLNRGRTADIFDFIQHSLENYNPLPREKQSDINAPLLWVSPPDGEPKVTQHDPTKEVTQTKAHEREHVKYLLSLCTEQVFQVNRYWDLSMDMWGQVALKQIQHNMPVKDELRQELIDFNTAIIRQAIAKESILSGDNLKKLVELTECVKEEATPLRDALYDYFKQKLKQAKGPPAREILKRFSDVNNTDLRDGKSEDFKKTLDEYVERNRSFKEVKTEIPEEEHRRKSQIGGG